MVDFVLNAQARSDLGKGASRRLRRNAALVPAIVYGGNKAPQPLSIELREIAKLLENETAFSHVISLNIDGSKEPVLIKALQRHPAKSTIMHADFMRIVADQKLTTFVPLHFINEDISNAVKQSGAEISHVLIEVEISCLPKDLPEYIEIDMSGAEIGQIVHLSDIKLPKGVELVALAHDNDLTVANTHTSRIQEEEEEDKKAADTGSTDTSGGDE